METPGFLKRLSKVDVADAVGVYVRKDVASVALVKKRLRNVQVAAVESLELSGPPEAHDAEVAAFLRRFVATHHADGARLALALEPRDTLISELQLPTSAADNIDKVVQYELDRIMPVAGDSLYHSIYTRPMGTEGERISVTVVGAQKDRVDVLRGVMAEAGAAPTAVSVQPVALCNYVSFCLGEERPLCGIFCVESDREYQTLAWQGRMISSHRFDRNSKGGRQGSLAREIERSLPERAGEEPVLVTEIPSDPGAFVLAGIAPTGFMQEDQGVTSSTEIVAIGAALGELGESGARLNLLPTGMVRVEQGIGLREIGLSALVAVLALVLLVSIGIKNLSVSNALAYELSRLEPVVTEVGRQQERNRQIAAKLEALESARKLGILEYMRALTVLVPKSAYLTTFRFRGNRLEVNGIADSSAELISILENSQQFKQVEFTAPTTKYLQSKERFSLRMGLEE